MSNSTITSQSSLWTEFHPIGNHLSIITPSTSLACLFPPFQATAEETRPWCLLLLNAAPSPRSPALSGPSLNTPSPLSPPPNPSSLQNLLLSAISPPISPPLLSPGFQACPPHLEPRADHLTAACVASAPLPLSVAPSARPPSRAILHFCYFYPVTTRPHCGPSIHGYSANFHPTPTGFN